jgi:hypothetical protein
VWAKEGLAKLLGGGDFVHDGLGCCARVRSGQDWSSNDQEIGAGADGFARGRSTGLIVVLGCRRFVFRPNARSYDEEVATARFANRAGFPYRGYYAVDAGLFSQLCEFQDAGLRRAADAYFAHCFLVHAGEDSDSQEARAVRTHGLCGTNGLGGGMEHGSATKGVHVYELHSRHGGARKYRAGDGIRNVVKLQVEEDAGAECGYFADGLRPCSGEELAADLEHAHKIGNLFCEFQSGR